jgi:hypothetical protein
MSTPRQRWAATLGACLTLGVLAGCGAGGSDDTAASPTASTASSTPESDARACVGVEAIIAHITVDTAHWSPTSQPFDKAIAVRLESQSRDLNSQALGAALPIRRAVADTSAAFGDVADAMMARKTASLQHAIARSRTAYAALKSACAIQQ